MIRTVFWAIVLAGVFILGLGYGKTLSSQDEQRSDQVTVTAPPAAITATLPTRTVTVTKTETVPAKRSAKPAKRAGASGN